MQASSIGRLPASSLNLKASTLASLIIAVAMLSSSIVFSEPAVADGVMLIAIVALPLLNVVRYGKAALLNYALWLGLVALGLAGTAFSTTFQTGFTHQLVTLYLASGAFASLLPIPSLGLSSSSIAISSRRLDGRRALRHFSIREAVPRF
jgi:hypothetical protein